MKKSKLIFSLLISMIILVAMSVKSSAVTLSTSETPSTVNSGSEFSIVLKFDEKITGMNAHIYYDTDLVTMSADNNQNIEMNPEYKDKNGTKSLSLIYSKSTAEEKTFRINGKVAEVTEEKVVEFTIKSLEVSTETAAAERLNDETFKITIKPVAKSGVTVNKSDVNLNVGESTTISASGTGTLTWKSSDDSIAKVDQNGKITTLKAGTVIITVTDETGNIKTIKVTVNSTASAVDSSVTNKGKLAKTGESSILLVIGVITIVALITGIKTKKMKLFVMLPLLLAVAMVGQTTEAKTVGVDGKSGTKIITGMLSLELPDLSGKKAIAVSPNDIFSQNEDKLLISDLQEYFTENSIKNPKITSANGDEKKSDDLLMTGDKIIIENTEYVLVLFGDANCDGTICTTGDINVIVDDWLGRTDRDSKAEGALRIAANVYSDKEDDTETCYLNVFDINRMKLKFNDKLAGTLINDKSIFTDGEKDDSVPVITPSGNVTLVVDGTENLSANKNVTWASSDDSIVKVESNGKVTGIKEGTATITATDSNGKTATITITVKDGVAQVGSEIYKTLQLAIDSINSSSATTVTLLKDITDSESDGNATARISSSQNVILDLNGHALILDATKSSLITNDGTLKIINSSSTNAKMSTGDTFMGSARRAIVTTGNLDIGENILIEDFMTCIYIDGTNSKPIVTMDGAELYCNVSPYNSAVVNIYGDGVFTMNSGIIKAENPHVGILAYKDNDTTVNILSGTIICKNNALISNVNVVNIGKNGGTSSEEPVFYSMSEDSTPISSIGTLNFYQGSIYANYTPVIDGENVETINTPSGKILKKSTYGSNIDGVTYEFKLKLDNE